MLSSNPSPSQEDLLRYGNHALDKGHDLSLGYWFRCCDLGCNVGLCGSSSHGGVQAACPFASGVAGKMGYKDFVGSAGRSACHCRR